MAHRRTSPAPLNNIRKEKNLDRNASLRFVFCQIHFTNHTTTLESTTGYSNSNFKYHIGCFFHEIRKMSKKKVQRDSPLDWSFGQLAYEPDSRVDFALTKTLLTAWPNAGSAVMAANAKKTNSKAYSTRSCP